jgi:hypothetical protein
MAHPTVIAIERKRARLCDRHHIVESTSNLCSMRCDKRIRAPKPNMETFMSIVDVANGRLLESAFNKIASWFRDLARMAKDWRIKREAANDLCRLSG